MKFAVNYSPQAAELLQEGKIEFDYFKCNEWPEIIEPAKAVKPIYVHFPNTIGNKQGEPDWQMIEDCLKVSKSPLINVHIIAQKDSYPHIAVDSQSKAHKDEFIYNALQDLQPFIEKFGAENIIAENLPLWIPLREDEAKVLQVCTESDVIQAIVQDSNIGFLFDIDHARSTCYYTKQTVEEYTKELPMYALQELHMTGSRLHNNWMEAHLEMRDEDWPYFEWALQNIQSGKWNTPQIFANEYGGIGTHFNWRSHEQYIVEQTPKFTALLKQYNLR